MLQQIGLVHMNGRVYDPQVAHFMSADILVSHPFSSQAWNGYSYVGNNPLNRVDPSGWQDVSYQLPEVDVIQPIRPPVVRGEVRQIPELAVSGYAVAAADLATPVPATAMAAATLGTRWTIFRRTSVGARVRWIITIAQ